MPYIKPFRVVDEHDVINLFKWSGTIPAQKGTFVKVISGWMNDQQLAELGAVGATYPGTVSMRYGVQPMVGACTNSGDAALGMLLYDVREYDENGEKLLFNPTKQAQMQCVLSGQAVPVVTRGQFLYSGVGGTPTAGSTAYLASDGGLSALGAGVSTTVGKFLGPKDANGWVLVKINL